MQLIELFWPAFSLAILLVFIHAIFGFEIIKRGVIFTDLAVGQIAAVGMALSIAFFEGDYQTPMTLLFAIMAALLISFVSKRIYHPEAFIGLLYALGLSALMLLLAQSTEGLELFKRLSAADILFTSASELFSSALLYFAIAVVMFFVYPRLQDLTKELSFFISLALLVTSSVQNAGVFVVFTLLIAPAYIGLIQKQFKPLLFSWFFGSVNIILAMILSYHFDLPTGYTMIFVLVLSTLVGVLFLTAKRPARDI